MVIYPAIDLLEGRAVRLLHGRYDKVTIYHDDPVSLARELGAKTRALHVVDLEGARAGRATQAATIGEIVRAFGPGVQVGGGVRTRDSFDSYLALGAERVVVGSAAIHSPDWVIEAAWAHPGKVVLAVDARDGRVAVSGWEETTDLSVLEVLSRFEDAPLGAVLYTDIARDGARTGPNVEATRALQEATRVPVLASGGVSSLADLVRLREAGIMAVIVGRALYDGLFTLEEAVQAGLG